MGFKIQIEICSSKPKKTIMASSIQPSLFMAVSLFIAKRKNLENPKSRAIEARHFEASKWNKVSIKCIIAIVSVAKRTNGSNGALK